MDSEQEPNKIAELFYVAKIGWAHWSEHKTIPQIIPDLFSDAPYELQPIPHVIFIDAPKTIPYIRLKSRYLKAEYTIDSNESWPKQ